VGRHDGGLATHWRRRTAPWLQGFHIGLKSHRQSCADGRKIAAAVTTAAVTGAAVASANANAANANAAAANANANAAAASANAYNAGATTSHATTAATYSIGQLVGALPAGCITPSVQGTTYYLCGNTWFSAAYGANGVYYRVVPGPGG
jgi:hypothetical protein